MIPKRFSGVIRFLACVVIAVGFVASAAWSQAKPAEGQARVIHKKTPAERKALAAEWTKIMKNHPEFARVFLAQQFILMETRERRVTETMCKLMRRDLPVLFEDRWIDPCKQTVVPHKLSGVLGCLTETNGDPASCFASEEDWFIDPTGRYPWPPKLPDSRVDPRSK